MECSSKACDIITQTIFPLLGILTSYFIFFSPFKEIQRLKQNSGQCTINPIPSVMIICNCLCWSLYSFIIKNHWTFWPNIGGILLGEYYTMILVSSNLNQKAFRMSIITLIGFTFLNIGGAAISFIFLKDNYEAAKNCMGVITIIVLCAMYVSPLTAMKDVIKTKNNSYINLLMTIASFVNGFLWVVYGFFFNDFYVWFPNGMGVISAVLQFLLYFAYYKPRRGSEGLPIFRDGENSSIPNNSIPSSPTSEEPADEYHNN